MCEWREGSDKAHVLFTDGKTTLHALGALEARGSLFLGPGSEVYPGMIIGEHSRDSDLEVNPVKEKKVTNIRNKGSEDKVLLIPPRYCSISAEKQKASGICPDSGKLVPYF